MAIIDWLGVDHACRRLNRARSPTPGVRRRGQPPPEHRQVAIAHLEAALRTPVHGELRDTIEHALCIARAPGDLLDCTRYDLAPRYLEE